MGLALCSHMLVTSPRRSWIPAFRVWAHLLGVGFDGSLPVGWLWVGSPWVDDLTALFVVVLVDLVPHSSDTSSCGFFHI